MFASFAVKAPDRDGVEIAGRPEREVCRRRRAGRANLVPAEAAAA
jgi:hypothetical protein